MREVNPIEKRKSNPTGVMALSPDDRRFLLEVARSTLAEYLTQGTMADHALNRPALRKERASFVTLRQIDSGALRGCRGECVARQPLVRSVAHMTVASATDDPRFPPVTVDEMPFLRIQISALGPLARIRPEAIELGRHGLMIVKGTQAGLLLPQAPMRYGWTREEFLERLCRKATLPNGAWDLDGVRLFGFESEVWEEA